MSEELSFVPTLTQKRVSVSSFASCNACKNALSLNHDAIEKEPMALNNLGYLMAANIDI